MHVYFTGQSLMKPSKIVINADDYALAPGVSAGIRELIVDGRVTATSAMTNSSFWPNEAKELQPLVDKADCGLHWCLTDQAPLTHMPQLAPNGRLPSLSYLMRAAFLGKLPLQEIATELTAQLDEFEQRMGRPPSHVDGHQHVHCLPGVSQLVVQIVQQRAAEQIYVRSCFQPLLKWLLKPIGGVKAAVIHGLGKTLTVRLDQAQIEHNSTFTGIYSLDCGSSEEFAKIFESFLKVARSKTLIMCHPGYCDPALIAADSFTHQREHELAFFKSSQFLELLAKYNCQPDRFFGRSAKLNV